MFITNHTRKTIKIGELDLPIEKAVPVDDSLYLDEIKNNASFRKLMLMRKITAVTDGQKPKKSEKGETKK